jgi:hypothetical protein
VAGRQLAVAGHAVFGVVGEFVAGAVAVAEVDPARPGRRQDSPGLIEDGDEVVEVLVQAGFQSVLGVGPPCLAGGAGDPVGAADAAEAVRAGRVAAVPGAGAVVPQASLNLDEHR